MIPVPILHHYDYSPFSEKIRLAFGLKGLAWHSVEARACADSERWRAAAEHWNQVERRRPLDEGEAAERQRARNKMSGNAGGPGTP